jgi:hypothetical protein
MQHLEQRRVDDEGFGVAHELGQDVASEGLQEAPQLAKATVQRGRLQAQSPGEQVDEEPAHVTQERALALHAPKLCWKSARVSTSESESLLRNS